MKLPTSKRSVGAVAMLVLTALSRRSAAVDPEDVYRSAVADFKAGSYAAACPKFGEARRLRPDSSPALQGLAQCYEKLGKTASAWGKYRELVVDLKARGETERSEAAAQRADELAKILSTVTIAPGSPDTPGLIIRLDGEDVPRVMFGNKMNADPGAHTLEATAPAHEVWRTTISIGDRNDARVVQVPALVAVPVARDVVAPSTPPPSGWGTRRIAGVSVGGVGVAGVIVGAVTGALVGKKVADSKASCTADFSSCRQPGYDLQHQARTLANVSDATFAIGGAAVITGVVLVATAPRAASASAKAGAWVTVGSVAGAEMSGVLVRGGF
jgi:hypothetical protein